MRRPRAPFTLTKHALPVMAMFAQAVEWARSQSRIETRPPGHISLETRERGGHYAYWIRRGADSKQLREYLGPRESEKHLAALATFESLKSGQLQARNLRKLGFEAVEHDAALVIAELCNAGLFAGGGVLIGTRAFGAILNHIGYKVAPFLGTLDVDLARPTRIKLASALPRNGFMDLLKQTGLGFAPVLGLERPPEPPTSFKVVGRDLKVDLLVPSHLKSRPYTVKPVPELGAHATSLPFLDYLLVNAMNMIIIGRDHLIPVMCPLPERYCLHKLIVADLRSGLDNPKIEKDIVQAGILAAILSEEDPIALEEAISPMTSAMAKHARNSLPRLEKTLSGEYPAAFDLMHRLLSTE